MAILVIGDTHKVTSQTVNNKPFLSLREALKFSPLHCSVLGCVPLLLRSCVDGLGEKTPVSTFLWDDIVQYLMKAFSVPPMNPPQGGQPDCRRGPRALRVNKIGFVETVDYFS